METYKFFLVNVDKTLARSCVFRFIYFIVVYWLFVEVFDLPIPQSSLNNMMYARIYLSLFSITFFHCFET